MESKPSVERKQVDLFEETSICFIDKKTGEIREGMPALRQKRIPGFDEDFISMFLAALGDTSRDHQLKIGADGRVLFYLLSVIGKDNQWKALNQAEIGQEIGLSRETVSRAIAMLVKKKIVLRGARIGNGFAYSLNPHYGWNGKRESHKPTRENAPRLELICGGLGSDATRKKKRAS